MVVTPANNMNIIDPHLHLFDLRAGDYHWLNADQPPHWPDKSVIRKNFSEDDLQLPASIKLTGLVHLEAGFDNNQPEREIQWLQQHLHKPFKSIAFADLSTQSFAQQCQTLLNQGSVVGIRHILGDQAHAILGQNISQQNLTYLAQQNLLFECQAALHNKQNINALLHVLSTTPNLQVVVNHCGLQENQLTPTMHQHLRALANTGQVAIKCSGWEMRDRRWQDAEMQQIVLQLLDIFGEQQVMLASNFPLTLFSRSYQQLWQSYLTIPVSETTINAICHDNAKRIYRFD